MITIRDATADDVPALAELRWEFRAGREPAVEDHDVFVERCAAWIYAHLAPRGAWRAWVADDSGRIVGHVWLQPIDKIPNPVGGRERHAYLSNLYVKPVARGGIGTRLLETALDWACANGVDSVLLWPTPRSRTLYARHGFAATGDFLSRPCA
jgi:GNAT superfamily N-acetyltransferase